MPDPENKPLPPPPEMVSPERVAVVPASTWNAPTALDGDEARAGALDHFRTGQFAQIERAEGRRECDRPGTCRGVLRIAYGEVERDHTPVEVGVRIGLVDAIAQVSGSAGAGPRRRWAVVGRPVDCVIGGAARHNGSFKSPDVDGAVDGSREVCAALVGSERVFIGQGVAASVDSRAGGQQGDRLSRAAVVG